MISLLLLVPICLLFTIASFPTKELQNGTAYESFPIQHTYGLGEHCTRFEDEAQELCATTSKPGGKRLAILMANCNLETLGQEPFLYNDEEGLLNATEAQQAVAVNMVTQLPVFCATLNVLGLRMGLITDQKMTKLNEALENLKGLSNMAFKFEKTNNQTIDIQKEILKQSQRGAQHAFILQDMATTMEKRMGNFSFGLDELLEKYEELSARWEKFEFDKGAAHALVNITVREAQLYWTKAQDTVTQSIIRKVEQQLRILQAIFSMFVAGLVWYLITLTRKRLHFAIFVALLITSIYGMYMFKYTALSNALFDLDYVRKAFEKFGETAPLTVQELTRSISIERSINGHFVIIFCCAVLAWLTLWLISTLLRRTLRTFRRRGLRLRGFDIHNSEEVIGFLKEHEEKVQQVENDIAAIIQKMKQAISEGEAQENALFTRFSDHPGSRHYQRIQNLVRNVGPRIRNTEGASSMTTSESLSVPIVGGSRPDVGNMSNTERAKKGKRKPPSPKSKPKQKLASKSQPKPLVVIGDDSDEEHDTDVTQFSLHSLSDNSLRNSPQNSTIITGDEEPLPQGREPSENDSESWQHEDESAAEVQSNHSSTTTVITEWDGIPLYPPRRSESGNIEMQADDGNMDLYEYEQEINRDELTTQVTQYNGSSGGTTSTWSRDSEGEHKSSIRDMNYSSSTDDERKPGQRIASTRIAKPILRPRGSHQERSHRRLIPQPSNHGRGQVSEYTDSSSSTSETLHAANSRRTGRRVRPMLDNIVLPVWNPPVDEVKREQKLKDTPMPSSSSGRERAEVGEPFSDLRIPEEINSFSSQKGEKLDDTNSSNSNEVSKSTVSQSSRQVSRSKSTSKTPRRRKSQISTTPSNYNLRRRPNP